MMRGGIVPLKNYFQRVFSFIVFRYWFVAEWPINPAPTMILRTNGTFKRFLLRFDIFA